MKQIIYVELKPSLII